MAPGGEHVLGAEPLAIDEDHGLVVVFRNSARRLRVVPDLAPERIQHVLGVGLWEERGIGLELRGEHEHLAPPVERGLVPIAGAPLHEPPVERQAGDVGLSERRGGGGSGRIGRREQRARRLVVLGQQGFPRLRHDGDVPEVLRVGGHDQGENHRHSPFSQSSDRSVKRQVVSGATLKSVSRVPPEVRRTLVRRLPGSRSRRRRFIAPSHS